MHQLHGELLQLFLDLGTLGLVHERMDNSAGFFTLLDSPITALHDGDNGNQIQYHLTRKECNKLDGFEFTFTLRLSQERFQNIVGVEDDDEKGDGNNGQELVGEILVGRGSSLTNQMVYLHGFLNDFSRILGHDCVHGEGIQALQGSLLLGNCFQAAAVPLMGKVFKDLQIK